MPIRQSEALVLRTYPYQDASLVVSFFSRDLGKLRGIARSVRRPKGRFGASLERLSHSRIQYHQKQTVELVRIDKAELLAPPLTTKLDYVGHVGLDYIAEVADQMLPDHEPNDAYFRLMALALDEMWRGAVAAPPNGAGPGGWFWRTLTYFSLWAVRLGGWLPPLDACLETGAALGDDETAWFDRGRYGLVTAELKTRDSWPLSSESRRLAQEMLRTSLPKLPERKWDRRTAEDLRRFLNQRLEAQFERRLRTAQMLEESRPMS